MRNIRSTLMTTAAVGAAAVGGAAFASAASTTSPAPSSPTSGSSQGKPPANMPPPGSPGHENAEKTVTGAAADKAKAAAIKAAGGGTATRVSTDFTGNGYEVTVKKTDGSTTEVHLDSSFKVRAAGRGGCGRGGPHGAMGPPPASSSSSSDPAPAGSVAG